MDVIETAHYLNSSRNPNAIRQGQELGLGRVSFFVGGYAVFLAVTAYLLSR
jgi:hypothetical protein